MNAKTLEGLFQKHLFIHEMVKLQTNLHSYEQVGTFVNRLVNCPKSYSVVSVLKLFCLLFLGQWCFKMALRVGSYVTSSFPCVIILCFSFQNRYVAREMGWGTFSLSKIFMNLLPLNGIEAQPLLMQHPLNMLKKNTEHTICIITLFTYPS